jgi:hypothetical protein
MGKHGGRAEVKTAGSLTPQRLFCSRGHKKNRARSEVALHAGGRYVPSIMADGNVSFHYRIYLKNRPGNPLEIELLSESLKDDFAASGDGVGITNNYQTASGGVFVVRLDEIAALHAEVVNAG